MSSDNRWRLLLSIVGALITASAIAGELTGYASFLGSLNKGLNNFISSFISPHQSTILVCKMAIIIAVVWLLHYIALTQYSLVHESCTLNKWIFQRKVFLTVPKSQGKQVIRFTKIILFILTPVKALVAISVGVWRRTKSIVVVSEMVIHVRPYMIEVMFLHAMVIMGGMALYLGLKIITRLAQI